MPKKAQITSIDTITLGYPLYNGEYPIVESLMTSGIVRYILGSQVSEFVWGDLEVSSDYRVALRVIECRFDAPPKDNDVLWWLKIEYSVAKMVYGQNGYSIATWRDVVRSYLWILDLVKLPHRMPNLRRIDISTNQRCTDPNALMHGLKSCIFPHLKCTPYGLESVTWGTDKGTGGVYLKCYNKQIEQNTQFEKLSKIYGKEVATSYIIGLSGVVRWELGIKLRHLHEHGIITLWDAYKTLDLDDKLCRYINGVLMGTMGKKLGKISEYHGVEQALTYRDKNGAKRMKHGLMGFWLQLRELGQDGLKDRFVQKGKVNQFYSKRKQLMELGIVTNVTASELHPQIIPAFFMPSEANCHHSHDFDVSLMRKKVGNE